MVFSREDRVKAMGWWSLVGAGGPVIGVSLGSPIIAAFGWRALFWVPARASSWSRFRGGRRSVLPRRRGLDDEDQPRRRRGRAPSSRRLDWLGSASLSIAVTLVMLALSLGPSVGLDQSRGRWAGSFVARAVDTGLFVYPPATCRTTRLIPAALLRTPQLRHADGAAGVRELRLLRRVFPLSRC